MKHSAIDDLRLTLTHARVCHEAWWLIEGDHPKRGDIVAIYNRYATFFGAIHPALFVTFVIKLSSLFDENENSISLKAIPGSLHDPQFHDLWERGRRLFRYRSKVIAHRDTRLLHKSFAADTGFTFNDLKAILDDSCHLFDRSANFHGIDPVHVFSCADDLSLMVHDFQQRND